MENYEQNTVNVVGATKKKRFDAEAVLAGLSVAAVGVLGCILGYNYHRYLSGKGLQRCFEKDPTLEEHMWKAISAAAMDHE